MNSRSGEGRVKNKIDHQFRADTLNCLLEEVVTELKIEKIKK